MIENEIIMGTFNDYDYKIDDFTNFLSKKDNLVFWCVFLDYRDLDCMYQFLIDFLDDIAQKKVIFFKNLDTQWKKLNRFIKTMLILISEYGRKISVNTFNVELTPSYQQLFFLVWGFDPMPTTKELFEDFKSQVKKKFEGNNNAD